MGDNKDFFRFRLGERAVIPAFEEAVQTMRVRARRAAVLFPSWAPWCFQRACVRRMHPQGRLASQVGGIRRIIVPVELGYPNNDMNALGPRPLTFSVRVLRGIYTRLCLRPWSVSATHLCGFQTEYPIVLCGAAGPACARLCAAEPGPDRQDAAV